jgi:hypothetical protein
MIEANVNDEHHILSMKPFSQSGTSKTNAGTKKSFPTYLANQILASTSSPGGYNMLFPLHGRFLSRVTVKLKLNKLH